MYSGLYIFVGGLSLFLCLFLSVPWDGMWQVIFTFSGHRCQNNCNMLLYTISLFVMRHVLVVAYCKPSEIIIAIMMVIIIIFFDFLLTVKAGAS